MQVIVFTALPARRTARRTDGMSIVDAEYAFPILVVQRQRIGNSMRPCAVRRYVFGDDLDPESPADLNQQAVEIKQVTEAGIAGGYELRYQRMITKKYLIGVHRRMVTAGSHCADSEFRRPCESVKPLATIVHPRWLR